MHHVDSEIDRSQMSMMALEEMVAENSYARLVDLFVEALPVDKLGFTNSALEKEGFTSFAVLLNSDRASQITPLELANGSGPYSRP